METDGFPSFRPIAKAATYRGDDEWGSGAYGAPRGERTHRGVDLVVEPGAEVQSPISGEIVREAKPYEDDERYGGVLIRGAGPWSGLAVKIFYIDGYALGPVEAGAKLGVAQDLDAKYPGITNHLHIEVWRGEQHVDPTPFFSCP